MDGTSRLWVKYRPLNAITRGNAYPFPSILSVMNALGSPRISIHLGCSRIISNIPVAKADSWARSTGTLPGARAGHETVGASFYSFPEGHAVDPP